MLTQETEEPLKVHGDPLDEEARRAPERTVETDEPADDDDERYDFPPKV